MKSDSVRRAVCKQQTGSAQLINRRLGDQAWERQELRRQEWRLWKPGIQEAESRETGFQQEQMGKDMAAGAVVVSATIEINLQMAR